jgi:hypothetical protein
VVISKKFSHERIRFSYFCKFLINVEGEDRLLVYMVLGASKVLKSMGDGLKVHFQSNHRKHFSIFRVFSISFKINFQINVSLNLTTKTSEYQLDVIQLSDQCFRDFFLNLLSGESEKSSDFVTIKILREI